MGAFAVALVAQRARADDTHYQDYIVGGRAVGLGGAFVSIADDPSGFYYNPAGVADARQSSLQLSTSLYGFERGSVSHPPALPVTGLENLDVQFTDLIIVPASAGFVKTFGRPGADGLPEQAYGVSVVVPSFRNYASSRPADERADDPTTFLVEEVPTYQRRVTDRTLWSGIGYGRRFGQRLRLGFSAYYVLRSMVDVEDVTASARIPGTDSQLFRTASNDISLINGNVVLIFGAKVRWDEHWSFGGAAQLPSIGVHAQSHLRFSRAEAVPPCDVSPECDTEPILQDGPSARLTNVALDGRSQTRYAPTVRLGASYSQTRKFTLSADASYYFPVDYALISSEELTTSLRQRLPFTPEVHRRAVANFNAGGEFLIVPEVSIAGGIFTDFSSSPKIPVTPLLDQPPRVNLMGLTMALGYFGQHTLSRLGVVYSFGSGRDVIPASDVDRLLEDRQAFKRVDYFQSFFYVFLSSTFRY